MGNKNDCPDRKVVLYEDAKRFADQMNISLFETSAKDNINVEEVSLRLWKSHSEWVMGYANHYLLPSCLHEQMQHLFPELSVTALPLILTLQMFTVMTKMVLQTKKEQKDRQMETNNPLRLHTPKKGKGKQKCC